MYSRQQNAKLIYCNEYKQESNMYVHIVQN